jgi:hypothetical protein
MIFFDQLNKFAEPWRSTGIQLVQVMYDYERTSSKNMKMRTAAGMQLTACPIIAFDQAKLLTQRQSRR